MKTTFIALVAALAVAGPSFAAQVTDARAHFAQSEEGGDGARYTGPTSTGDVSMAIAHFAADDQGDGASRRAMDAENGMIVSTSNGSLAAFAKAKLHNDERGDN